MSDMIGEKTEEERSADPGVWGPLPTLGLSLGIGIVSTLVSLVVMLDFLAANASAHPGQDAMAVAAGLQRNGFFLSVSYFVSAIVIIGLVVLCVKWRKGLPVREYLGIRRTSWKVYAVSLLAMVAMIIVMDAITKLMGKTTVPQYEVDVYRTCRYPLLIWLLFVVGAPICEEVFFRGFVLEGFRRSRMGNVGAITVTAAAWAFLHYPQYDLVTVGIIAMIGLLLGAVRVRSSSLLPCIAMHAFMNFAATVELLIHMHIIKL